MTVTLVQSAAGQGTGTSKTVTLGSPTTAGNCLVVLVAAQASTSPGSVSGVTLGGSADNFASLGVTAGSGTQPKCDAWADPDCAGGQTAVAVSTSGATGTAGVAVFVFEFSGVDTASPLDKSSTGTTSTSSFSSGTTATTSQADEAWVGMTAGANASARTINEPGAPWTNLTEQDQTLSTLHQAANAGYQIVSSTGTATYSGSYSGTVSGSALVVTLKGAGATAVTGTGSAALPVAEASGTAQFIPVITGTGSAAVPHLGASGNGLGFLIPNTGQAALPHLQASGTGAVVPAGTGSATFRNIRASGTGQFIAKVTGTGSAALPALQAAAADEGALQPFKTLILHRPRIDAPPSLTPFVTLGSTDAPDGTEYDVPSLVSGVSARFDGTYSILLVNNTWHSPTVSRTLTVTIHQYEYTGGPSYTASVSRTLTPSTDITNGLVDMGSLTLPIRSLSPQNVTAYFTVGVTSGDTADRFLDVLFLDAQGSTVVINSPTAYNNFFVDEPDVNSDLGAVMGSAFDRPAAVSVLGNAKVSGGPLMAEPGDNLILAYCVEGAPALAVTYSPRWWSDALA